ncbi:hypothetical protein ACJ2PR_26560 [Phormidesmis sp. 146-33]
MANEKLPASQQIERYGLDHLRNIVFNLEQKMNDFLQVLSFLSCTYYSGNETEGIME